MFKSEMKKSFGVDGITSDQMITAIRTWLNIYRGTPEWVSEEDGIKTINMAKSVCSETSRLVNLAIDVQFDGRRKDYMQKFWDNSVKENLRSWVEYGCAVGTVILKPNGTGVDFVMPGDFEITEKDGNGHIAGIVFQDQYQNDDKYYTKQEYHRFWKANVRLNDADEYVEKTYYMISNRAYVSDNAGEIGKPTDLVNTKWSNLKPDVYILKQNGEQLESMLFGVLRMPSANAIDMCSPLGVSMFSDALQELKDLDIAYSRNAEEIDDSASIELIDDRLLSLAGNKNGKRDINLPRHALNVYGASDKEFYQSIDRPLKTNDRIVGINNQLSFVGYKCGYSNGYFVFDQKTGMVTATQVEADDRRTIQLIKDIRDALQNCLNDLFYAQSVFADLYNLSPVGEFETVYDFGDITYNEDEDRMRWWQYVVSGKMQFWRYLVKFEGFSEEEAKEIQAEQEQTRKAELFEEE